ncbi:MAG: hypothetical protein CNLJKLNK_00349 [Holosporales bacterium]
MKPYLKKRYILAGLLVASLAEKADAGQGAITFQAAGQAIVAQNNLNKLAPVAPQAGVNAAAQTSVAVAGAGTQTAQPQVASVGTQIAKPQFASVGTQTALPALTPAEAAKKMKGALGEPLIVKTKCSKEYGNVKWADVKELVDRGYSAQVMAHFTKNATGCDPVKDKDFMANMKKSCDAAAGVADFPLKTQHCGAANKAADIKAATIATVQAGAKDDALFPSGPFMVGFNKGFGCPADAAATLNLDGLSQYYARHFATSINPSLLPQQRNIGIMGMKRADDYLDKLQKCSVKQGDKNFNTALAAKFPGVDMPMRCATLFTAATLNNAPPAFVTKIQGLCASSKNTGTLIDIAKQVADIKKAFNVPMTPLGYVNLPESLITPLTAPDAAEKIATWSRLDATSFDKHFNALWDGLTTKPGKVVNPKASAMMVTACTTSLKDSKNPKIQRVCEVAKQTVQNNSAVEIKGTLGANGKTFNCKAAMNINAVSVVNLLNANPTEGQTYLANVSGCLQNGDAMLAAQVLTACQAGLSGIPAATDLCALADQKNTEAAASNNALGGVDPNAVAADSSAVPVDTSAQTADASAVAAGASAAAAGASAETFDASTQTDDASAAAAGASAETFDASAAAAGASAETFDASTQTDDASAGLETVYDGTGNPVDLNAIGLDHSAVQ